MKKKTKNQKKTPKKHTADLTKIQTCIFEDSIYESEII